MWWKQEELDKNPREENVLPRAIDDCCYISLRHLWFWTLAVV